MPLNMTTLADKLQQAGYDTHMAGKVRPSQLDTFVNICSKLSTLSATLDQGLHVIPKQFPITLIQSSVSSGT